jgi:predicted ribosome quality control (RQC) complex YloA/Tae2 family protein
MSLDGNMIKHLTNEFKEVLETGRINKIYQTSKYDLLFLINTKTGKKQLLISSSPSYARIHITERKYEKPDYPPTFCMFLRKQIESGIIKDIHQKDNDRIIIFTIEKRNEMGDLSNKFLILEMMGRHSNIIVTDSHYKILESIKHNMPFDGPDRTIFPGAIYEYPTTDQINPYSDDSLVDFIKDPDNFNTFSLQSKLMGYSPLIAREIMYRFEEGNVSMKDTISTIRSEFNPTLIAATKEYFYYTDITSIEGERKHFETVNELLERYYYDRDQIDIIKQKSKDLVKFIQNGINRLNHKVEKLNKDLSHTEKRDKFRIYGELVQANIHLIKKGDSTLNCVNYYTNEEVIITLDNKLTPIKNSEKFFKKYKKFKNSIPHINEQIENALIERKYFFQLEQQIENASLKDIEEIKDELVEKRYLKGKQIIKKRKKKLNYETYKDALGIEITIGKNNKQNEYITHKLAKHNEVWFHTKDAPGSHVLVHSTFPLEETTIRTAAMLAAYNSKMKHSSSVAVDYLEVRHIKKVPGRISSFVTYKNQKTIYIDPDEEFIINLTKK